MSLTPLGPPQAAFKSAYLQLELFRGCSRHKGLLVTIYEIRKQVIEHFLGLNGLFFNQ